MCNTMMDLNVALHEEAGKDSQHKSGWLKYLFEKCHTQKTELLKILICFLVSFTFFQRNNRKNSWFLLF